MLTCRLHVLAFRFQRVSVMGDVTDWLTSMSTGFSFLTQLATFDVRLLAVMLSKSCRNPFRRLGIDDLTEETSLSAERAKEFDDYAFHGQECIMAGLEREVTELYQVRAIVASTDVDSNIL